MNSLVLNNKDDDKKMITYTIDKNIKAQLKTALMESPDYNLKQKSHWVNEAIILLKENGDHEDLVSHAEGHNDDFVFDKIYMTFAQRCVFAEIRNEVVKKYPDIKGPQGAVIRAAILGRLLRKA